ncbi:hypothetical protein C8Q74DRAFT_1211121 [Fomes fomentarius]|nr:hypothetical protein C8Q74DRAFT_1211121 [Fomes fomentarius]
MSYASATSVTSPSPPPGFVHAAVITPCVTLALIGTACSSALIPIAVVLFYFSTAKSRRRPLFILNTLMIILGLVLGCLNAFIQMTILHGRYVRPELSTLYTLLIILIPTLADSVLLMRVVTVYPPRELRLGRFIVVYGPITTVKLARLVVDILFIVKWTRAVFDHSTNTYQAGQQAWGTPFPKLAWFLQLADSTYASTLFLSRLREGRMNSHQLRARASAARTRSVESEGTATSYYYRLRTLFWISVSNFVFPVILNLVQLILAFRNPDFLDGAYVLIVNNYISVIGVLLATIWSTSTKVQGVHSPDSTLQVADADGVGTQSPRFAPTVVGDDADDIELFTSTPTADVRYTGVEPDA